MTSFVREVLSASGTLAQKENFSGAVARLQKHVDKIKSGLRVQVEAHYEDFVASYNETVSLIDQLEASCAEADALKNTIAHHLKPGIENANKDLDQLLSQLNQLSATVTVANLIKEGYNLMEKASELVSDGRFMDASEVLGTLEELIKDTEEETLKEDCDEDQIKAFKAIQSEFTSVLADLNYNLTEEWNKRVKIESKDGEKIVLILDFVDDQNQRLNQLIKALDRVDLLSFKLSRFSQKFLELILKTIFLHEKVLVSYTASSLTITKLPKILSSKEEVPRKAEEIIGSYTDVLDCITSVFKFLDLTLGQVNLDSTRSFISLMGEHIADEFIDLMIEHCLCPAIPNSQKDLSEYELIVFAAENLQTLLQSMGFIKSDNSALVNYSKNVESIFVNKRVTQILSEARDYVKEDLHVTVKSSDAELLVGGVLDDDKEVDDEDLPIPEEMKKQSPFKFPNCVISASIPKLLQLVERTMEEACDSKDFISSRLLHGARNIFQLFISILPVIHKDSLRQFPQHSALAHNNCFFLAHTCLTLGLKYQDALGGDQNLVTFVDFVPHLRHVGENILNDQIDNQRELLRMIVQDSGFNRLATAEQLPPSGEKSLRQILHQLGHLRKVWIDVLPPGVFVRVMGSLVNSTLNNLINCILVLEDIAADSALQIVTLFSQFRDQAPSLFLDEGNIVKFVSSWMRFKELIIVLNASLREIEDRWADGKGPLASEFKVDEIKRLIRALFQNTERRATVLSRIKYET